jgi:hypothetical protein
MAQSLKSLPRQRHAWLDIFTANRYKAFHS